MAVIDSLGGAIGLQGRPDSYVGEAMNNARYARAEEERKRREQAKKDEEASDKYHNIISKLKVEGYDPIYNDEIKKRAGRVIGILNDSYKKNKFADPYNNQEFTKELQDFQIFSDEAKQATKALSEDYTLTTGGKKTLKPELASALQQNDYNAYQQALGGQKHYRRGMGINNVEDPFDYVSFKGKVNTAFKPFDKTIEYQDPKTGNFVTVENQFYQNPVAATSEVLASDPKAVDFFTAQYKALPVSKQKEYSAKAQAQGGSGVAYVEYAKERLFPDEGLKAKTTLQQPNAAGAGTEYYEFSGEGEVLPKPYNLENIPEGAKLIGKVEKFAPLKQDKVHRMIDPDGNILEVSNVRKVFYDDGTVGYEGKTIEESRVKRRVKDSYGRITETEELLPQYAPVVMPYENNKQVEFGEKGFNKKGNTTAETKTEKVNEVERIDKKSGKTGIFNADTKKFIRWK